MDVHGPDPVKITIEVSFKNRDPFTVKAGPRAISGAEKRFDFRIADGKLDIESVGYMAWMQAVEDGVFLGPWDEFWSTFDDLNIVADRPDPTGLVPDPSPGPS